MAINLEPLYHVRLAWWICWRTVRPGVLPGAAVVLGAVFWDSWRRADSVHGEQRRHHLIASDPVLFRNAEPPRPVFLSRPRSELESTLLRLHLA